jgi:predicted RNA-binding Zn-ribbon protein involved in translation (DUF1610 family)
MYRVACPACGAEVRFHATTSVLAVCPYCQSTLLRDADSVRDIGKMAALLDDYSPLQIASCGIWKGRQFTVVGRIQLAYDAGMWNEWHLLFDDGSSGWLSESVGQYVLTLPQALPPAPPAFDSLHPGLCWEYKGTLYTFSDIRQARCVSGEGELPFKVGAGYGAPVADARSGGRFLTLDYTANPAQPALYLGDAVTLKQLNMQRLRDARMIQTATGKLKGSVQQLACPQCGAGLDYRAGTATHLHCPSCHSEVDIRGEQAEVIARHQQTGKALSFTLQQGDIATIDGKEWTLIGTLRWEEVRNRNSSWNEYLLYNIDLGFRWLTETSDGWYLGTLMDVWVDSITPQYVMRGKRSYAPCDPEYAARISYAAGAFPWRAAIGDVVQISEFENCKERLALEQSKHEITWSCSREVSPQDMSRWFGRDIASQQVQAGSGTIKSMAKLAIIVLLAINVPILFLSSEIFLTLCIIIFALLILYAPLGERRQAMGAVPYLAYCMVIILIATLMNLSIMGDDGSYRSGSGGGSYGGHGGGFSGGHK